jgi:hypothetical protein
VPRVEPVVPRAGGEEHQRFTERVELELAVDPVPDDVVAARIAGQPQMALVGYRLATGRICRSEVISVLDQLIGDEPERLVEQRKRVRGGGSGESGVALVADPDVAVVVVPAGFGALGQAGGCRCDHPAGGAGETA